MAVRIGTGHSATVPESAGSSDEAVPTPFASGCEFDAASLQTAERRLRGHLARTPIVGGLMLPVAWGLGELRVALERLQPTGTLRYRGALHVALRQFGARKGMVFADNAGGPDAVDRADDELLAHCAVAYGQRVPMLAIRIGAPPPRVVRLLGIHGCELEVVAGPADRDAAVERACRQRGFAAVTTADEDYRLGVATLALDLESELPTAVESVGLADPRLAAAVDAGFRAIGSRRRAHAVSPSRVTDAECEAWRDALPLALRSTDLRLLHAAPRNQPACVVLGG